MRVFFAVESDKGLESRLDDRFGRAACFLIYDTGNKEIVSFEENPFREQDHGVGIHVANYVIQKNCQTVVGPKFGPKAESVLKAGSVSMLAQENVSVKQVLEKMGL